MTRDEKRQKVLLAATDCFSRFGYEKTTLEDIGKTVGLNKASLYYYYKNKESIFCDVLFRETDAYMNELHSRMLSKGTSENKILVYLAERVTMFRNIVNLHNLLLDTVRKVEPVFSETYEKILHRESTYLEKIIKEGIETGEFIHADAGRIARALLDVATSLRYRALHISYVKMAGEADYEKVVEEIRFVARLILKGIKNPEWNKLSAAS